MYRVSVSVLHGEVCVLVHDESHHLQVSLAARVMQRGPALCIRAVDSKAARTQDLRFLHTEKQSQSRSSCNRVTESFPRRTSTSPDAAASNKLLYLLGVRTAGFDGSTATVEERTRPTVL